MLNIADLRSLGADVDSGLARCVNNEALYIRLVNMAIDDSNFTRLADSIAAGDLKTAFEAAHALKGVSANLSLTPICSPVSELTELLRHPDDNQDADYAEYVEKILSARNKILDIR